MKYFFINDNKVAKIEEHEDDSTIADGHLFQIVLPVSFLEREPKVGWVWDGKICFPDLPDITPRQCRQALILSGITMASINDALHGLPEPTSSLALAEWEYSIAFKRRRPLVQSVAQMLGWTEDQLDDLWRFASTL